MSLLSHVVLGSLRPEPAATQALAYLLNTSDELAQAFNGLLDIGGFDFEPGRVETEFSHENGIPDLTIHDSDGRIRLFAVENKFLTGLTEKQPVFYLKNLLMPGGRGQLPTRSSQLR